MIKLTLFSVFSLREPELVLLDMQSVPAGQEGWLAFDVTSASNHWLLHPRSNLGIRLYVETEEGGCHHNPLLIVLTGRFTPRLFEMVYFKVVELNFAVQ